MSAHVTIHNAGPDSLVVELITPEGPSSARLDPGNKAEVIGELGMIVKVGFLAPTTSANDPIGPGDAAPVTPLNGNPKPESELTH